MIELAPPAPRVSSVLFEALLRREVVKRSGREYFIGLPRYRNRRPAVEHIDLEDDDAGRDTADGAGDGGPVVAAPREASTQDVLLPDDRVPDDTSDDVIAERCLSFGRLLEAGAGHLAAARAAYVEQCRQAAVQVRELAAFAAQRPAVVLDRPDGEVGAAAAASRAARPAVLTAVSEWAVDEVMVALALSSQAASGLLAESVTLVERLPATVAALEAGAIGWAQARALAEIVGPVKDEARAEVEARLLARADGKTVTQLKVAARRAVLRADAAVAARRLVSAIRDRGVRVFPGADGMGSLSAVLSLPVAAACRAALEAYADDCRTPGDERTKEQRMADCLVDLILRPGVNGPVQIGVTVVAGVDTLAGGDEPGEVGGQPVPAILVRELAYTLGLLPRPEEPRAETEFDEADFAAAAETAAEAATVPAESLAAPVLTEVAPAAIAEAALEPDAAPEASDDLARAAAEPAEIDAPEPVRARLSRDETAAVRLAELLGIRTIAGTALTHIPRIAIVEEVSGQLLALTDATQIRRTATGSHLTCRTGTRPCTHPPGEHGLGPPPGSPGYTPSAALARFVRARDRRCRFPGCRAAAIRCDLDHNTPWPAGTTSAENLCCLCRHHHRLSHQAPGWTMHRGADGGLRWTTPGGHTVTTYPPRYGTDDDLPSPAHPLAPQTPQPPPPRPRTPPLTPTECLLGRPLPPGVIDDEPPPF